VDTVRLTSACAEQVSLTAKGSVEHARLTELGATGKQIFWLAMSTSPRKAATFERSAIHDDFGRRWPLTCDRSILHR
jgi:hypothetical protein